MHTAVMPDEAVDFLGPEPGDIIIDCTVGAGGHARKILERIMPQGRLIGIDQDAQILKIAGHNLADFKENVFLRQANFRNLDLVLSDLGIGKIDGALFDLGVSSLQLDDKKRGFSFSSDGPLDMRMSGAGSSAADIVNSLGRDELADIVFKFGEERYSRRIAQAIVNSRRRSPIRTTAQLAEIVSTAVPRRGYQRIHPATRTFQALRIFVNDELNALEAGLEKAVLALNSGARICVISFHSLEDRIVKNFFKNCAKEGILDILTKKPVTPKEEELKQNPRSRSAKLRAASRKRDPVYWTRK